MTWVSSSLPCALPCDPATTVSLPRRTAAQDVCVWQGMLGIACAIMGAPAVLGIDVDADALRVAQDNVAEFGGEEVPMDLLRCDFGALVPCYHAGLKRVQWLV